MQCSFVSSQQSLPTSRLITVGNQGRCGGTAGLQNLNLVVVERAEPNTVACSDGPGIEFCIGRYQCSRRLNTDSTRLRSTAPAVAQLFKLRLTSRRTKQARQRVGTQDPTHVVRQQLEHVHGQFERPSHSTIQAVTTRGPQRVALRKRSLQPALWRICRG